ncbi:photosystem II protein PsbQ [Phormidium sp. CLA17]|uniref:photosystem II protein PsbQ n=1 Tax=Leptolyngbya sp. Cla-17 TaxID=2803751 RepID=UPI001491712D|nr:photosystem II protein PsbQ [Leptolyngbya sp. Cla-17]MBM0741205.1 photosystem II protein PsbQ [Leptolyngbya sp. Cla-17]
MVKIRSIMSAALALLMVLVIAVGQVEAAKVKKPLTYAPEQLEQIQGYATELQAMRDRLPELGALVQQQDWTFTRNFIHGPLGELRVKMQNVSRVLLPDAQPGARKLAKEVFNDLTALDLAAQTSKVAVAQREYGAAVKDFDSFLAMVPEAARLKPKPPEPIAEEPKTSFLKELLAPTESDVEPEDTVLELTPQGAESEPEAE